MGASWSALHTSLMRSSTTLSFQRRFEALRRRRLLARFADPAALFDHLHAGSGDPAERNEILKELASAAQASCCEAPVALLMLALWPGLDAVHRRLARHFRCDPDELAAEISARLTRGIRTLDLGRVNRIAATLVRNVERDIRRDLRRRWQENAETVPLSETDAAPNRLGQPDSHAAMRQIRRELERTIGDDARLVVSVAVQGETRKEAGARLGLSHDAVRKRYQRARKRLRGRIEEFV